MQEKLKQQKIEFIKELDNSKNDSELESVYKKFLGRKGSLTALFKEIANLSGAAKKETGILANNIKKEAEETFKKNQLKFAKDSKEDFVDVTLPGKKIEKGHLNPLTIVKEELADMFTSMGFMVLDGPELESDYYCFEALNIPPHHPARDMQDTFYVKDPNENKKNELDLVMRTHTSSVQIRAMKKYGAPLRCVVLGNVFRNEATDATHEHSFNQIEGMMIGEKISISNLIAVLKKMFSAIYKQDVNVRIRPGYFPYVEPGLETDISCTICGGKKCPACKHSGWLEMGGSGMIHPNVFRAGGIDPDKYSGFAFGYGLERMAMMRFGINDVRLFRSGNLKFLNQF